MIVTFRLSVSATGCAPPWCSSVNGVVFLKQPLFGDEAGFSAAVIGAFLSSLSRGIVFRVVHHDENFQLFYGRTNVNLADVCLASTLLMQSAQFSGS